MFPANIFSCCVCVSCVFSCNVNRTHALVCCCCCCCGGAGRSGSMTNKQTVPTAQAEAVPMLPDQYCACMTLALVGDAVGYHNGRWEFRLSTQAIHDELMKITEGKGMRGLHVYGAVEWLVSDDSVMHLACARALTHSSSKSSSLLLPLCVRMAQEFKGCSENMTGRAPGKTTMRMLRVLHADGTNWDQIPFNSSGGGCGGAMRAMCIGLRFPSAHQLAELIAVSVECGRMTHHHPVGYLGAYVAALFTAYAIQRIPVAEWGCRMLQTMPQVRSYLQHSNRAVKENLAAFDEGFFQKQWQSYLQLRRIEQLGSTPVFPTPYGVRERDQFYYSIAVKRKNPGKSGHDVVLIAYDSLLGCSGDWQELCLRGVLHCGDNDTTGTIAAAWFGAVYGLAPVPNCNYADVQYQGTADSLARTLYKLRDHPFSLPHAHQQPSSSSS